MTEAEALAELAALREQARGRVAAGDVAATEALLVRAIWLRIEPETPTSRALGFAFGTLAAETSGAVRPQATLGLLERAGHAFQHAPDAQLSDFVVTLNNLAGAHGRAGDGAAQAQRVSEICQLAAAWQGEVDAKSATIFITFSQQLRRMKQYAPMLPLLALALRFMLAATDIDDAVRAAWLREHAQALREAGELERLRADLDAIESALRDRAHAALSLGLCALERSHFCGAQGDWRGAGALIDRALAAEGLPPREQTELLSLAARAWFNVGDFDAAAERSRRALRRRVGLTG